MSPHVLIVPLVAVVVLGFLAFGTHAQEPDAADARQAALRWTEAEFADAPRRDGDEWEVDVRRADGSLVEVTLGRSLELRRLDEELGPAGALPHDEVTGALRGRAIAAAREVGGRRAVRSVEHEPDGSVEVDFAGPAGTVLEVELDQGLRVTDVDREDVGDE